MTRLGPWYLPIAAVALLATGTATAPARAEPMWVLQSARTNPQDAPRRYEVGVTPNYYSQRFAGSFEEAIVSEAQLGLEKRWRDRGHQQMDVTLVAKLSGTGLQDVLKPGESVGVGVDFNRTGAVEVGNPGIVLQLSVGVGAPTLRHEAAYFPFAPGYTPAAPRTFYFNVPSPAAGELVVDVSLKGVGAAWVRRTYRIEERAPEPRGWEDLVPDYFKSPLGITSSRTTRARGAVIEPRGEVMVYSAAFRKWRGPMNSDTQVYEGDRVRTGPRSSCRVVFTNRAGRQDTVSVGSDTLLEIPSSPRPELSIAAKLVFGIIAIDKALRRAPGAPEESPFLIRTMTVCTGRRGTTYAIRVRADGVTDVLVEDGLVGVFELDSRQLTELGARQQASFTGAGGARVAPLGPTDFAATLQAGGLGADAAPTPDGRTYSVPELRADVRGLRLYEGPDAFVPLDARVYATRFPSRAVRRLWWQLDLAYPSPARELHFALEGVYTNPDGSVRGRMPVDGRLEPGWTSSQHSSGWGTDAPGSWAPGRYRLTVLVNGREVAAAAFEVAP